ncbi:hypothetical protein H2199_005593 [Coniosporium tulheliwenetii]|uniref:Uncharacterized protein n=1 Tax=Coniosporium tulheliwenetii TaxID=3383036 RepID=A0ACC2Z021_9PEZI|nr:hypothetical protein H2199_005593 [Cladosporium sp. JES 115]
MPSPLESVELEATSYFPQVPSIRSFGTVRRTSPRETFRVPLFDSPERRRHGSDVPPASGTPSSGATRLKPDSLYPPRCPLPQLRTIPPGGSPAQSGSHETASAAATASLDTRSSISPTSTSESTTKPPVQVRDFALPAAARANSPHDSHISDTVPTTAQTDVQPSSPPLLTRPLPTSSERILGPPTHYAPNSDHTVSDQVFLRGGGLPSAHHFRATLPARRSTISAATTTLRAGAAAATALHSAHARRPRYVLLPQRAIDDEQENSGAAEERAMLEELRERERALGIGGGPGAGAGGAAAGGDDALGVMDETPPREGRFARIARGG